MAAEDDKAPPAGGREREGDGRSWGRFYAVVLAWLAVVVLLLTLLTWVYR